MVLCVAEGVVCGVVFSRGWYVWCCVQQRVDVWCCVQQRVDMWCCVQQRVGCVVLCVAEGGVCAI